MTPKLAVLQETNTAQPDVTDDLEQRARNTPADAAKPAKKRGRPGDSASESALGSDAHSETKPQVDAQRTALEAQLQEKEQLIVALTDRLEQAAEQLDRLRRSGADRGVRRGAGGGMPPELVEDHRAALDDLKQVIARWDDMQAGMTLGRLETQVSELRDLIAGYVQTAPSIRSDRLSGERSAPALKPAATGPSTWWESQKAALMGETPPPAAQSTSTSPAKLYDAEARTIPDLPPAVDFDNLTSEGARQAIVDRDSLIQKLREPLLLLQAAGALPKDLNVLAELPAALQQRIAALESAWEAKFRQAELDLSLERARLARAEGAIRQHQEQQRRDEHTASTDKEKGGTPRKTEEEGTQRRWFRFLGSGHAQDEDDDA